MPALPGVGASHRHRLVATENQAHVGLRSPVCLPVFTTTQVFDKPDGTGNQDAEAMTRRTSVLAGAGGKNMAFPDSSPGGKGDHPEITVGVHTHVGDPETHANEDRATAVLDLLGKFAPENVEYQGDDNRMLSFFGVYDGQVPSRTLDPCWRPFRLPLAGALAL